MPAITADTITLDANRRSSSVGPRPDGAVDHHGPRGSRARASPSCALRGRRAADLDPFVHMDQMGEVEYAARRAAGHGLASAPRLRDRHLHDRRTLRAPGLARRRWVDHQRRDPVDDGGAGILHIETPPAELVDSGGVFHGIQLWVNLPRTDKFADAAVSGHRGSDVTLLSSADGGALVRVIAGDVDGHAGPGSHPHADHVGTRHDRARRAAEPAMEPGVQRARLRAVRPRLGRAGRPTDPPGPARGARRRRPHHGQRRDATGLASPGARSPASWVVARFANRSFTTARSS